MEHYQGFLTGNLMLDLAITAWFAAQMIKVLTDLAIRRKSSLSALISSGGMPSSHSAFVCACASTTGMLYGWSSPLFAIAAVVAIVVMYDASNVRRAAGEQAKILNYMMDHWMEMKPALFSKELKELLGHTPIQVLAGGLLGTGIGLLGAWLVVGV